ncbi:MAG: hypothetical protein LBT95_03580 [Treponema sp.]|jgi:hypothetical protein|nr:hypothetical protein [Treponema sp.]
MKNSTKQLTWFLAGLGLLLTAACENKNVPAPIKTNRNGTQAVVLSSYPAAALPAIIPEDPGPEEIQALTEPQEEIAAPETAAESGGEAPEEPVQPSAEKPAPFGKIAVEPAYASRNEVVEIREKMFIAQVNDVYLNPEDYLGKTLKFEGIFQVQYYYGADPYYFVIRYGPGCCGNDGNAGFEILWDGAFLNEPAEAGEPVYPEEGEWVEAAGVLGTYEEDGYPYLCIALASLKVLDERGAEFVTQ